MDSAACLARFNALTGRPSADAITSVVKYGWLAEAQRELIANIAAIAPHVLYPKVAYGSLPTLATTDNQVFTFRDGIDTVTPFGKVAIYPSLSAIPSHPWREGLDFINEGTQIRIPDNRTYAGTLYWRGIVMPDDMTASVQPALYPEASRILIPYVAALNFSTASTRNLGLADEMRMYLGRPWGEKPGAFSQWCTLWRTQFRAGGVLGSITGRDLALAGQHRL